MQKELDCLRKKENDKEKLDEKISDQSKTIQENEKRFSDLEEKLKKTEALLAKSKEKTLKLEKEVRLTLNVLFYLFYNKIWISLWAVEVGNNSMRTSDFQK